ncbi:AEC family transporter [Sneathia vaginalis]|uniref:AEC family transporter n=1 Tax=Sneathia vaginalis TaxID=187101 RepID=UPI0025988E4F|nr:AEC family transporter [uncultured Sneathia sp.]
MTKLSEILNTAFLSAIACTVIIILIGYYLRKKNIVPENCANAISSMSLSATLPPLAFTAFMQDIRPETFTTGMNVLIFSFVAYIFLIMLGYLFYFKYTGRYKKALIVFTAFGSTTFFAIPIIDGIIGSSGTLYANIFNIGYRVFLYTFGLIMMSDMEFELKNLKKIFLNPIIIATFLGLVFWLLQNRFPILRIDRSFKPLFFVLKSLAQTSAPLAFFAIGMTLANVSLKECIKEKMTIIYCILRLVVIPAIFLVLLIFLDYIGIRFEYNAVIAIIIMLTTPPATVAVSYAIKYDNEAVLASNISLIGTFISIILIIFWVIVLTIAHGYGII